jgi:hypothetical protein
MTPLQREEFRKEMEHEDQSSGAEQWIGFLIEFAALLFSLCVCVLFWLALAGGLQWIKHHVGH